MSKKILIHVGHGKTGSSYIQSSLDKSTDRLAELEVFYPLLSGTKDFSDSFVRSGNVNKRNLIGKCRSFLKSANPANTLLLSNENLLGIFSRTENYFKQLYLLNAETRFIVFTRDPLELAISGYGQIIKRGGFTGTFDEYVSEFDNFKGIFSFFELAEKYKFPVSFINYSNVRKNVLEKFSLMVGVPEDCLRSPDVAVVNRSLSSVEMYIQRRFNENMGRDARKFIADPLCQQLPDIKPGLPTLSEENFFLFKEKMNKNIIRFNEVYAKTNDEKYNLIIDDHYLAFKFPESKEANFYITGEQLDVLISSLEKELTNPFSSLKRLIASKLRTLKKNHW